MYPMLPVCLDCQFVIAPLVLSTVYIEQYTFLINRKRLFYCFSVWNEYITIETPYTYFCYHINYLNYLFLVTTNYLNNLIRSHVILLLSLVVNRKPEILFWEQNRNNPTILINQAYLYFYLIIIVWDIHYFLWQ